MVKYFKDEKNATVDWPGNSPDLNLIENLWPICKARLQNMDCTTKTKMVKAVIQVSF